MRLRTLPVSLAGVIAALGYAKLYHPENLNLLPWVICLIFALLAQISSNFANEYYDYKAGLDRKGREGPRRGVTEGDITPNAMKAATYGMLIAAACAGLSLLWFGGWWLLIPGVIIVLGALAYSTGPWPLSRHALGEVAVIVFFGLAPVGLTYYLLCGDISDRVIAGAIAFGLMGANVLMINNIRDIPDDKAVGKTTLANLLGHRRACWLYMITGIVASLPLYISTGETANFFQGLFAFYPVAIVSIGSRIINLQGRALTPFLGITAMLMALESVAVLLCALF